MIGPINVTHWGCSGVTEPARRWNAERAPEERTALALDQTERTEPLPMWSILARLNGPRTTTTPGHLRGSV